MARTADENALQFTLKQYRAKYWNVTHILFVLCKFTGKLVAVKESTGKILVIVRESEWQELQL